jgi:hypothetical protein
MNGTLRGFVIGAAVLAPLLLLAQDAWKLPAVPQDDVLLRAMRDEMQRIPQLGVVGGKDAPYFASYTVSEADSLRISSVLGSTVNVSRNPYRSPEVEIRIGNYDFDNTGHVQSGGYSGTRLDGSWPLDANYLTLRNSFWLTSDRVFKTALESISRKRASQNNATPELNPLPNFSKAEPVVSLPKVEWEKIDQKAWEDRSNRFSGVFRKYPEVVSSAVEVQAMTGTTTLMTSEGTLIRYEDGMAWALGKADAQSPDGMIVHDGVSVQALTLRSMPSDAEALRAFTEVAENVRALSKAPAAAEAYTGPVLFEPRAAAQLLAQLLGDNLRINRRPLAGPGQPSNVTPSDLETRLNARVLPAFFDVVDDATQATYNGKPLAGHFDFDLEGVRPQRVSVIEKGLLKNFLTTRTPVRGFPASNGHARLPGSFGARTAAISNLFVKANESMPLAELKQQLLSMITVLNKPYGILVRKLDFPYSGAANELQSVAQANAQGGATRPVSPPILVYRVYPDGREELVRGLRFRGVSARSLRDVLAASQETAVFEYVNTTAALAALGSGGYLAPASVISPGLLFEELEFEIPREQFLKPPVVPPPTMNP